MGPWWWLYPPSRPHKWDHKTFEKNLRVSLNKEHKWDFNTGPGFAVTSTLPLRFIQIASQSLTVPLVTLQCLMRSALQGAQFIRTEVPGEVGLSESSGILFLKTFESWRSLSVEYTIAALKRGKVLTVPRDSTCILFHMSLLPMRTLTPPATLKRSLGVPKSPQ